MSVALFYNLQIINEFYKNFKSQQYNWVSLKLYKCEEEGDRILNQMHYEMFCFIVF